MWYNPVVELVNLRKKSPKSGTFFIISDFLGIAAVSTSAVFFCFCGTFFDLFFLHYSRDILIVSDDRYLLARREHPVRAR